MADASPFSPDHVRDRRRAIAAVVLVVWLLAIIAAVAVDPMLRAWYRDLAGGMPALDHAAQVLTDLVELKIIAPLVLILVLLDRRLRYWFLVDIGAASVGQGLVEHALKHLFGRLRPDMSGGVSVFTGPHADGGFAFPSGHALASFAIAGVLSAWYPRWRWLFIAGAVVVCLARVQLDRHFFGDVLFGSFLGWYLALGVVAARQRLAARLRRASAEGGPAS